MAQEPLPANQSGERLMYQALFELPSGELRLEPVTQVLPEQAAIHYTGPHTPMRPGLELPCVRIFAGGTQVLTCAATVGAVGPSSDGKTMNVSLLLRPADLDAASQVQQSDVINAMVRNLLDARATAVITVGGTVLACATQLIRAEGTPSYLVLEVRGPVTGLVPKAACELTCQLYGARVLLRGQVQELLPGRLGSHTLHIRWPHAMVATRRRAGTRVQKLAVGAYLGAHLPFAKGFARFPISDLSRQGLAFQADASSWITPGMVVPNLEVHVGHTTVRARGTIRNVRKNAAGKLHVGLAFNDLSIAAERTLDDFVSHHTHPSSRMATARDVPALWPLLREVGLVSDNETSKAMRQFESTRSLLLTRAPQLLLQTVQGNPDSLTASAELVRVADKGWRLQHLISRDESLPVSAVIEPLLQVFTKRNDTAFLQLLWPVPSPIVDETSLFGVVPKAHMQVRLWGRVAAVRAASAAMDLEQSEEEVHTAGATDRQWVARRLQRFLSPMECEALDCAERRLSQDELSRLYRTVGLDYQRLVRMVSSVSEALGFSLIESSPMGLSLDGSLPAARLFSVEKGRTRRQAALATLAQDASTLLQAQGHTPTCLVSVDDAGLLAECGYKTEGWYAEVTVEHSYVSDVPGLIHVLRQ